MYELLCVGVGVIMIAPGLESRARNRETWVDLIVFAAAGKGNDDGGKDGIVAICQ